MSALFVRESSAFGRCSACGLSLARVARTSAQRPVSTATASSSSSWPAPPRSALTHTVSRRSMHQSSSTPRIVIGTSMRVPRWATARSSSSSLSASPMRIRQAPGTPASATSRNFATVVHPPTAPVDDLPEPPLEEHAGSALDTLNVTAAAERQLALIQERDNNPNLALRVLVESGGCHGYSTKLQLADISKDRADDDYVLCAKSSASESTKTGLILIDALTLSLIKGSTLDYVTELIGSSFRLVDNPQSTGKGCGCGVSWELKI